MESGGYASDLLMTHSAGLDARDAGLAAEIVFGVLRYRAQLDFLIEHYSGRARKLDLEVRIALRMGIYQLRYLERIPPHAAVKDSVELVKRAHKTLRRGLRQRPAAPGQSRSRRVAHARNRAVLPGVAAGPLGSGIRRRNRRRPSREPRCASRRSTSASRPPATACRTSARNPSCRCSLSNPGSAFSISAPRPATRPRRRWKPEFDAIACDLHFHRLAQLKPLTANLVVLDGTRPLPFARRFDRILVDAPCSGTGTLGRNPEIKWRLTPDDLDDLQRRQSALLANARAALAPGGLLVYSTCSLEPEENEGVTAAVPAALIAERMRRIPGRDAGDGFYACVIKSG